jgi:hypothetical protein
MLNPAYDRDQDGLEFERCDGSTIIANAILDDDGSPILDDEGNPILYD